MSYRRIRVWLFLSGSGRVRVRACGWFCVCVCVCVCVVVVTAVYVDVLMCGCFVGRCPVCVWWVMGGWMHGWCHASMEQQPGSSSSSTVWWCARSDPDTETTQKTHEKGMHRTHGVWGGVQGSAGRGGWVIQHTHMTPVVKSEGKPTHC